MEHKFYEAAYIDDNKNIINPACKLEDLIAQKNHDETAYEQKYGQNLFCPECHTPQLCLVRSSKNQKSFYLRGFPKQKHKNNCSYSFDIVKQEYFSELLKNGSDKFINTKLKGIINNMLKRSCLPQNPCLVKIENNRISTENIQQNFNNKQTIKRLPTKSLSAPLYDEDFNSPKIFYGNVNIKFEEKTKNNSIFHVLNIYNRNSNTKICSFSISEKVFSYWNIPQNFRTHGIIHENVLIAIATTLTINNGFVNGRIIHSNHCEIEASS